MHKRGDTLVEIMFAVGIFGLVAIGAIGIMNKGLYDAQKALEITMARQEIDAQAEALRFLHEAYLAEEKSKDPKNTYSMIWKHLQSLIYKPSDSKLAHFFDSYNGVSCNAIYSDNNALPARSTISVPGFSTTAAPFIVNTRRLDEATAAAMMNIRLKDDGDIDKYFPPAQSSSIGILIYRSSAAIMESTPTYPRLLFSSKNSFTFTDLEENLSDVELNDTTGRVTNYETRLAKAQGIWIVGIASADTNPEFYDFHIRTCWTAPGETDSTTISTTVRLYNPDHH